MEELGKMFVRGREEVLTGWEEKSEEWGKEAQLKVYSMHFSFCPDVCVCVLERGFICIHEPQHACSSCVYVCVLKCVCRWVHSYEQRDQRAVLWGRKGSDSKIEYKLSSAASLSIAAHFALIQPQYCLSCISLWAVCNLRSHFASVEDEKKGSYEMLLEMLEHD